MACPSEDVHPAAQGAEFKRGVGLNCWKKRGRRVITILAALAVGWVVLRAVLRLPELGVRPPFAPSEAHADTRLGRALAPLVSDHPGKAGILALADGRDAFAARVLLAGAADRTLDVQYYIWHHDTSGALLFDALRKAADRGVWVRLLLDDNSTGGLDEVLAGIDAHPNIEVRLFNPFNRTARLLGYVVDFVRVNRRMHNKSFTADGQATIVGGRNVADEYFAAGMNREFVDLDVLAVGPVAQEVARDFDRYWASESSYPADRILPLIDAAEKAGIQASAAEKHRSAEAAPYLRAVADRAFVRDLLAGTLAFEWADARLLSDDPAKVLDRAKESTLLWPQMKEALGPPRAFFGLVSAYFVPTRTGAAGLSALARQGVTVRVLTNSLEATDLAVVHSGYAKHRHALLSAGVELFEIKREFAEPSVRGRGFAGSSSTSLHAKTFSIDRQRLFVGSFNFDPRSARLNTEIGLVIESPTLARSLSEALERAIPTRAYRVRLTDSGRLQWIEQVDGREVAHDTEPGTTIGRRALVTALSWLPIDWLL